MSKLEKNYNWNGNYLLIKELGKYSFKISNLKYPEKLYIFINEDNTIDYTILDDNFGMPSPANTMDVPHAIKLRNNAINILEDLERKGYIVKC